MIRKNHISQNMSVKLQNPSQFRENVRSKLRSKLGDDFLLKVVASTKSSEQAVVANIEKGAFNYAIQEATFRKLVKKWENPTFTQIYLDRLRTIFNNLDRPVITNGIISGEILPQSVAFMTHQEFQPEKWNPLIEKKIKRDASKCNKKVGASTDMFTCSRCQSKNCTYYEMQTRSADEPATIFITCLNCDKHWRI